MAAAARAAHPIVDSVPHLLDDDAARRLCAAAEPSPLDFHRAHPAEPVLAAARLSAVTRAAYTENRLRTSGLRQYVVLGAGLDTSGFRLADESSTKVWHVDLPDVLAWRAALMDRAGLEDRCVPVAVDLAAVDPVPELVRVGLDPDEPVFVAWLGVSMYLDAAAVRGTLGALGTLARGSELVFDHIAAPPERDAAGAAYVAAVGAALGAGGEPWRCTPSRHEVLHWLEASGWTPTAVLEEAETVPADFWPRTDALTRKQLVRLAHARR
ncbi:class I SAM-dependent methyltransferase [Nakamurella lactea]|uniref:class I SAM-dependent methyltransferase n=1 Tax=Nakamurella lactea TaxID=459515 RepID=UPI0003FBC7BF|nr:SAM-dependent methyltransferase [Nakamurella lactea]